MIRMVTPTVKEQLDTALKSGLLKAKTNARVEDLVEAITTRFGGTAKIADRFFELYDKSKPGGIVQAKVLESYTRMLQLVNKKEPAAPLDQQTDADLMRRAMELMQAFAQSVQIVEPTQEVANATPQTKPVE